MGLESEEHLLLKYCGGRCSFCWIEEWCSTRSKLIKENIFSHRVKLNSRTEDIEAEWKEIDNYF